MCLGDESAGQRNRKSQQRQHYAGRERCKKRLVGWLVVVECRNQGDDEEAEVKEAHANLSEANRGARPNTRPYADAWGDSVRPMAGDARTSCTGVGRALSMRQLRAWSDLRDDDASEGSGTTAYYYAYHNNA